MNDLPAKPPVRVALAMRASAATGDTRHAGVLSVHLRPAPGGSAHFDIPHAAAGAAHRQGGAPSPTYKAALPPHPAILRIVSEVIASRHARMMRGRDA